MNEKLFERFGLPIPLLKDTGLCPNCKTQNLLMEVDEEGVSRLICKKCGWEKDFKEAYKK